MLRFLKNEDKVTVSSYNKILSIEKEINTKYKF
jgi:hypothetical protein